MNGLVKIIGGNRLKGTVTPIPNKNSILPALIAWSALLLPASIAIVILLCGFILLLVYELVFARPQGLPHWYISMRIILTTVVSFCLMISLTAVILK